MQQSRYNNDPINIPDLIKYGARMWNDCIGKILQEQNMILLNFETTKDLISVNKIKIKYTIEFAQIK